MKFVRQLVSALLCCALIASAEGNTWKKVRYNGGTVSTKVDPKDWDNQLTVTSDLVLFTLKDGQKIEVLPKSVTSLSYGQEAHRRVGTMIALGILVAPVALFGLFHKTRLHFIGMQYTTAEGKNAGLLLQGDKDNYRAILVSLQSVTGVPVSVAEKEREFIPVGVTTNVAKESEKPSEQAKQTPAAAPTPETVGTVAVATSVDGADVYVDEQFVGNCPATLKLKPGKHVISVKSAGYKDWSREITVQSGSEVKLAAGLEKSEANVAEEKKSKP